VAGKTQFSGVFGAAAATRQLHPTLADPFVVPPAQAVLRSM
jgi:hypothetical protein